MWNPPCLQQERVKPTPEIRAKAAELTKGASDDNAKLRAIYNYVSTEFRYIGIAFGIGCYQPHTMQSDEEKHSRSRLEYLTPGSAADSRKMLDTSDELNRMRTFKLPRLLPKSASAEFFVLLAPGSEVEDVKFISGSKELEPSAKALRTIDFKAAFPDEGPARLLRRGILSCYEYSAALSSSTTLRMCVP
jgi:hypothetical protein